MTSWEVDEVDAIATSSHLIEEESPDLRNTLNRVRPNYKTVNRKKAHGSNIFEEIQKALWEERLKGIKERAASVAWWNSLQCRKKPVYGTNLRKIVTVKHPVLDIQEQKRNPSCYLNFSSNLADIVLSPIERFQKMVNLIESFMFAIPAARSPSPVCWCSKTGSPALPQSSYKEKCTEVFAPLLSPIRPAIVRRQVYFPDRRLIQFDCGKLQQLAVLLRRLKSEGHRALIFTQMTKMLDILEAFINLYGYTYMRLDGSTPPEERQTLMQRFNTNPKIFLFILSTRSGGVGINLVGADTVIFYDSDWNPAMDQQAQDRCHRIGQTREVHIYRLISVSTIEENILKKANQKRALDDLVIQSGGYNTEFFKKLDPIELFSGHSALPIDNLQKPVPVVENSNIDSEVLLSSADVEAALKHVEDEADYMALKKVEEEEAVDNQEFTEDAIGRLEEDEFVNEDDIKPEERVADEKAGWIVSKEMNGTLGGTHPSEERSLTLVRREEDVDMLADVKQLAAAAAAAGQASSSFENQLRPIDRYAMRFLDLWDPIIDKSAIETQVAFEEEEWELDRIEKLKEDLEAEIDEDEEPLVYETWDADFATEAYRQEVEALAQRQLEELEAEAKEAENADDGDDAVRNEAVVERKSKSKKKTKKTKFKSLKKGALASESEAYPEEPPIEVMYIDDKVISPDREASSPRIQKKRKKSSAAIEDEKISKKPSKKVKKPLEICPVTPVVGLNNMNRNNEVKDLKPGEIVVDLETKPACRSKIGGKISIMAMPIKRVLVIKPEKLKKKGSVWSKECVPPADPWSSQEDAILCAIVHEYGSHWNLVSDTLYGMTGGGFYRGRFRHPFHCCERFRELCYKYVVSTTENPNNEKINPAGSLKALIKVSEDHVRTLLDVASELPDNELLLQKHFTAIISSVWRAKYRFDRHQNISTCNDHYSSGRFLYSATCLAPGKSRIESEKINKASFAPHRKLVAAALNDACKKGREEPAIPSHPQESQHIAEKMEITLEFQDDQIESRSHLPWSVNLSISGLDIPEVVDEAPPHESLLPELSCNIAEKRLRMASTACFEGEILGWASTTFPTSEIVRPRPGSKSQLLGKHKATPDSIKPPKSKHSRSAEPSEESSLPSKPVLPPQQNVSTDSFGSLDHLPSLPGTMEDDLLSLAMDNSIVEEGYELVSHCFDPNFIAGLDDCELTKQITDIG